MISMVQTVSMIENISVIHTVSITAQPSHSKALFCGSAPEAYIQCLYNLQCYRQAQEVAVVASLVALSPWLRLFFGWGDGGQQLTVDFLADFLRHTLSNLSDELL